MTDSEALLTTKQMCDKINVTSQTLLKWARDGLVPCHKMGKKMTWFIESEVRKAMKEWNKKAV